MLQPINLAITFLSPVKLAPGRMVTASTMLAMLQAHATSKLQHIRSCSDLECQQVQLRSQKTWSDKA